VDTLFDRHIWLLFLLVTAANAALMFARARRRQGTAADELGPMPLIRGFLLWTSLPWLVMGAGLELGGVASAGAFVRADSDPYVFAFFAVIVGELALGTYWLFARGGAERLAAYPWLFRGNVESPATVKLVWVVCVAAAVISASVMWAT
jgi:hypothetical protein